MEKKISKPEGRATFRFGSTKTICQLRVSRFANFSFPQRLLWYADRVGARNSATAYSSERYGQNYCIR
jgi:hypothetical protein